jgi:hypothetical protein
VPFKPVALARRTLNLAGDRLRPGGFRDFLSQWEGFNVAIYSHII